MSHTNQRAQWQKIIQEQKESGLTVAQFCEQHDLRFHQFHYYKKVLFSPKKKEKAPRFTEVKAVEVEPDQGRLVIYLNQVSVTFEGDYDLNKVAELCRLLDVQ